MTKKYARSTAAVILLAIFIAFGASLPVQANSAEPQQFTIIAAFPPDDLTISIRFENGSIQNPVELEKGYKAWESYYRFYYSMMLPSAKGYVVYPPREPVNATLAVHSSEYSFEYALPQAMFERYNRIYRLDAENQSLIAGHSAARSVVLISMRLILTLLIEGLIFYGFGYRKKRSWTAFFIINLVTQGVLNFMLNGTLAPAYWFIVYGFLEIIIFLIEMIAFRIALREQSKTRAAVYALTANFASLVLGGILISYLPV